MKTNYTLASCALLLGLAGGFPSLGAITTPVQGTVILSTSENFGSTQITVGGGINPIGHLILQEGTFNSSATGTAISIQSDSSFTVTDGAIFTTSGYINVSGFTNSSFTVSNGAQVTAKLNLSDASTNLVTGAGSVVNTDILYISGGYTSLEDSGYLVFTATSWDWEFYADSDAILNFDGGYFALAGTTSSAAYTAFSSWVSSGQVSIGGIVTTALADFTITSGTGDYSGYTLITASSSPVPEPATYAAIAGSALLAFALLRHRHVRETACHP